MEEPESVSVGMHKRSGKIIKCKLVNLSGMSLGAGIKGLGDKEGISLSEKLQMPGEVVVKIRFRECQAIMKDSKKVNGLMSLDLRIVEDIEGISLSEKLQIPSEVITRGFRLSIRNLGRF